MTKEKDPYIISMCPKHKNSAGISSYDYENHTVEIHVRQNVCAGSDSPTTYECAAYFVKDDKIELWRVVNGLYVVPVMGYLIFKGPHGTKNKYLTYGNDGPNEMYPESLGKFSHSGLFLTELEARKYANELISKRQSDLRELEYYHLTRIRELNPTRKMSGIYY